MLPRGGLFAGAQTHDRGADAQGLSRLHRQVAGQAVALVEEADDSDPLAHGCAGERFAGDRRDAGAHRRHTIGRAIILLRFLFAAAAKQGKREDGPGCSGRKMAGHWASGAHAS
ncbi:MAG: hypothetical protein ABW048_07685 [Sphingobium sp.]